MNTAADFFILFAVGLAFAGIGIWIGVRSERAYWMPRCKDLLAEHQRLASCMRALETHQQRQAKADASMKHVSRFRTVSNQQ